MLGLTLTQILATSLLPNGIALTAMSDLLAVLMMLALVLAFAGNAATRPGRLRVFWLLQAVSWAVALANQGWWTYYDVVLRKPVPLFFAGDVLPFFPVAFMLAGFLLRPHFQQTKRGARRGTLDFLLLMVWWFYLYLYMVLTWQFVSPNEQLFNRNYTWLYFAANLVMVVVLIVLVVQSDGAWRRFYGLFLCAELLKYGSFVLEDRAIDANVYFSGSWFDCLYSAMFAVFMVVAMKGRSRQCSREDTTPERGAYGAWMAGLAILAVLSLPVILLFAARQNGVPPEVARFRVLVTAAAMFTMAGLVFMRQLLMHEELKDANHALEESATTDPLTGVRNRRFFLEAIEGDVAQTLRAHANGDDRCTWDMIFYLIDLDGFKQVNDVSGHDAGDRVLIETARRIRTVIRSSDVLVRWGGEEFLIVSRHTDRRNAEILAQRILDAVRSKPFAVGETEEVRVTCSIGWAPFPWLERNVDLVGYEGVLKLADRALYRAKQAGKDQAIGMTPSEGEIREAGSDELETCPSPTRALE